jgi:hypothetical protein
MIAKLFPPPFIIQKCPSKPVPPPPQHFDASYAPGCSSWIESFGLTGMQLLEKYKENFDVSSEGPSSGSL